MLLGAGKRLFGAGTSPSALKLIDSKRFSEGVAVDGYEKRTGKPQYGSVPSPQ